MHLLRALIRLLHLSERRAEAKVLLRRLRLLLLLLHLARLLHRLLELLVRSERRLNRLHACRSQWLKAAKLRWGRRLIGGREWHRIKRWSGCRIEVLWRLELELRLRLLQLLLLRSERNSLHRR